VWTHHLVTRMYYTRGRWWVELDGSFWITVPRPSEDHQRRSSPAVKVGDHVSIQRGAQDAEVVNIEEDGAPAQAFHPYECHHLMCGEARLW
jgi:hypothetical protein